MQAERALFSETEQAGSEKGFANPLNLGEAIKSRGKKKPAEKSKLGPKGAKTVVILNLRTGKKPIWF